MTEKTVLKKPVIGLTAHMAVQPDPRGHARDFHRLGAQYTRAVRDAGGLPLMIPTNRESASNPADIIAAVDGLLISGGTDLPPHSFVDDARPGLRTLDPVRYDYEAELIREAWRAARPMMGICRGHQMLVEVLGGALNLNVSGTGLAALDHRQPQLPRKPSHSIQTVPGSMLAQWIGESVRVNSFHRQAVDRSPKMLKVCAVSEDGLIEAVESASPFVLGIQWHPEWLYRDEPKFLNLFKAFVNRAGIASVK